MLKSGLRRVDRQPAQRVSVLFNEPKLLKCVWVAPVTAIPSPVSVLFNEPKLLKSAASHAETRSRLRSFSALQRAEIAEISTCLQQVPPAPSVSVLFNEPKLLKSNITPSVAAITPCFSALQRAEIAEIEVDGTAVSLIARFSALQRAEIAEIQNDTHHDLGGLPFQCSSTSRNC